MINLNLGDYSIQTLDRHNICLIKRSAVTTDRFGSAGNVVEKRIGYFPTLEGALNAYCRLELQNGEEALVSASDILSKIDELKVFVKEVSDSIVAKTANNDSLSELEDVASKENI